MKKINAIIICLLTVVLPSSCDSNKKLEQADAENAILEFVQTNSFGGGGSWGQQGSFDENSILSIEPISQFTEVEANSLVYFNYQETFSNGNLCLKFNFKRNIDKQWVLTSVDAVSGVGSQGMSNRLQKWKNVNILVQKGTKSRFQTIINDRNKFLGNWTDDNYYFKIIKDAKGIKYIETDSNGQVIDDKFMSCYMIYNNGKLSGKSNLYRQGVYYPYNFTLELIDDSTIILHSSDASVVDGMKYHKK